MLKDDNLQSLTDTFTKIVTFNILNKIKYFYNSLDDFKNDWSYITSHRDKHANLLYSRIVGMFHLDSKILQALTRDKFGKRQLKTVLKSLDKHKLVYKGKKTATYKSGKQFQNDSWFYIPFSYLDIIWNIPNIFDTRSNYYSKEEHKLIDKWILGYRAQRTYVKTTKFYDNIQKQKISKVLDKCKQNKDLTANDLNTLIEDIDL